MKEIRVTFDDSEFETLLKAKDGYTWREFILMKGGINYGKKNNKSERN